MAYKVIRFFTDLQDGEFAYREGDTFPREGKTVTAERLKELSSAANLQGVPLIKEVRETKKAEASEPEAPAEPVSGEGEPKKQRGKKRKD